jgi:hypothetical protein
MHGRFPRLLIFYRQLNRKGKIFVQLFKERKLRISVIDTLMLSNWRNLPRVVLGRHLANILVYSRKQPRCNFERKDPSIVDPKRSSCSQGLRLPHLTGCSVLMAGSSYCSEDLRAGRKDGLTPFGKTV